MGSKTKTLISSFLVLILMGCSAKKNAFLNRSFHSVTTKYNVLYNGQVAYDQAKQRIDDEYVDNFWEVLPIEPLKIEEEKIEIAPLPGQQKEITEENVQGFEKAELKAIKAIQKHSMEFDGRERNKQIDDAYLLLGKTRYYSQRFVPALEAFNFILGTYSDPEMRDETKLWQAKTLVRLQNEKLAIETLDILLKNDNASLDIIENAHIGKAMIYQSLDSVDLVIKHLDSAVLYSVNPKQKARNLFILGQLHRQEQHIDSSNLAFDKLINFRKAPYRYRIHAEIDRAKNYSTSDSTELVLKNLYKLIKNRDNRPYLDELYYQTAAVELKNDSINTGITLLNKSLRAKDAKPFQQELSYELMGNTYFDLANFKLAGSYYDSVIQITESENSKRIRRIARKRRSLNDVILFEDIAKVNDSILTIVAMDTTEQKAYFQNHIDQLKEEAEAEKRRQEILAANSDKNFDGFGSSDVTKDKGGKFYFYNVRAVGFGEQEFKRIWGNRALEDNWRLSDRTTLTINDQQNTTIAQSPISNSQKFELSYYLDRIPKTQAEKDSIKVLRDDAYYQLGLSYKEQFKENKLAADRLETLLSYQPAENLILPIKYHLQKIYEDLDPTKSNILKEEIVTNYPDTRYAKIIENPDKVLVSSDEENTPESIYNAIYCDYDYEHYDRALKNTEEAIKQFEGLPIIPKFELLKAYLQLKLEDFNGFKEGLNFVALNYANTEEGKHASKILDDIKKKEKEENKQK